MEQLKWKVHNEIETNGLSKNEIVETLNTDEVERLAPMFVFLLLIIVTGIPGNGLVCYIYRSKYNLSSSRWFIFFLAAVDLVICVTIIPCEVMTSFLQYTFKDVILCKVTAFFNVWSLLALGLTLLIVSIDRYRKVCRPTHWQIDFKKARILSGMALAVAFIISLPTCWVYDVHTTTFDEYNITVHECSTGSGSSLSFAYLTFGMVLFSISLTTICILYGLIGAEIKQHIHRERIKRHLSMSASMATSHRPMRPLTEQLDANELKFCRELVKKKSVKFHETHKIKPKKVEAPVNLPQEQVENVIENNDTEDDDDDDTSGDIVDEVSTNNLSDNDTCDEIDQPITRVKSIKRIKSIKPIRPIQKSKSRKVRRARARKATFSMFLISLAFVLGYLPFLTLLLARSVISDFDDNFSDAGRAVYKFFLRTCFLNCAINPFIYGISDSRFRESCREVVSSMYERGRKSFYGVQRWNPTT